VNFRNLMYDLENMHPLVKGFLEMAKEKIKSETNGEIPISEAEAVAMNPEATNGDVAAMNPEAANPVMSPETAPLDVTVLNPEAAPPPTPIADIQAQQINVMTAPVTMIQSAPVTITPPLPQGTSDAGKYEEFLLMPDAAWPPPIFLRKSVSAQERFYISNRWHSQWQYYDKKATEAKQRYQTIQKIIGVGSVIVPILVGLGSNLAAMIESISVLGLQPGQGRPFVDMFSVVISGTVGVAAVIESVHKYGDDWNSFRSAAEELLAEKSFYDMQSGPYANNVNPFATFVDRTEGIIANQNGKYFQAQQQQLQKQAAQNDDLLERYRGSDEVPSNAG
jgi:hypothetical protein